MPVTPTTDNIELLNEEVREILGTPPRWIIRWGNMLLLLFIALLLLVATLVKRYERVSGMVTIIPNQPRVAVSVPLGSIINSVAINDGATVQQNELLVTYNYAGTERELFAPQAGTASFQRLMQKGMRITSDSLLMLIAPANQTYSASMLIGKNDGDLIQPGQQVSINTNTFSADMTGSITGTVITKPIFDTNSTARISLQLQSNPDKPFHLLNTIKADGEITISEKRLISTLFSF